MPQTMIERLTERLGDLWSQSENPMAEMRWAASRMLEHDLSDQQPNPSQNPHEFARMLLEDNPEARAQLRRSSVIQRPESIETAEQLINGILPAQGSLD